MRARRCPSLRSPRTLRTARHTRWAGGRRKSTMSAPAGCCRCSYSRRAGRTGSGWARASASASAGRSVGLRGRGLGDTGRPHRGAVPPRRKETLLDASRYHRVPLRAECRLRGRRATRHAVYLHRRKERQHVGYRHRRMETRHAGSRQPGTETQPAGLRPAGTETQAAGRWGPGKETKGAGARPQRGMGTQPAARAGGTQPRAGTCPQEPRRTAR